MDRRRRFQRRGGLIVLAAAAAAVIATVAGAVEAWNPSGSGQAAPMRPTCAYAIAEHQFKSDGAAVVRLEKPARNISGSLHGVLRAGAASDPIFRRWLSLYCRRVFLGPATSAARRRGPTWFQEFTATAHRMAWNSRRHRVWIQKQPKVAAKMFARHGIHPQWNLSVPAAWLTAFYSGTDYGPALEPVNDGAPAKWQQQVFEKATGTFQHGAVRWALQPRGSRLPKLYNAFLWRPIGRTVQRFDVAARSQNSQAAATYLVPRLAAKVAAACPQKILGLDQPPVRFHFAIREWGQGAAQVKSVYLTAAGRVVDRFDLRDPSSWKISSVRRLRGFTEEVTCPPWSPPANAFPGTYAVGDSVMVDAQPYLQPTGITVDAMVDRQFDAGIAILQQLKAEGRLPPRVVIGLGTNGGMTEADYSSALQMLRGEKRVVILTVREPRTWQDATNAVVHAVATKFKNVRVADWFAFSAGHPEWFADDGIHLQASGAEAFAHCIANALAAP